MRSFFGYYQYNSIAEFNADKVAFYQRVYGRKDAKVAPAAEFDVAQLGFYIQDEWAVLPHLKITYGIRIDIPTFLLLQKEMTLFQNISRLCNRLSSERKFIMVTKNWFQLGC